MLQLKMKIQAYELSPRPEEGFSNMFLSPQCVKPLAGMSVFKLDISDAPSETPKNYIALNVKTIANTVLAC